jgi:prepilin-type N-terminal cleavage/methylation domain-containing protein
MRYPHNNRGLTLIELLVSLVLTTLLIAALYKTFMVQHKTYTVQEQVVDMQQNVKAAAFRMVKEIRMAGFGRMAGEYVPGTGYVSRILPVMFRGKNDETILYRNILNRDTPAPGCLTIITATHSRDESASLLGVSSRFEIIVDKLKYNQDRDLFNLENKRYVSIDGVESNVIIGIAEETVGEVTRYRLTLQHPLQYSYLPGTRIFPVTAMSFQLAGIEKVGGDMQSVAENIESATFEYFDDQGNPTPYDGEIRMVRVAVTARTDRPDPALKEKEGYRRRQVATNIQIRNLSSGP